MNAVSPSATHSSAQAVRVWIRKEPIAIASSIEVLNSTAQTRLKTIIERIDRLGAEPRQEPLASAFGAEHTRIEAERRFVAHGHRQPIEASGRFGEAIALFRDISLSDEFVEFLTIPAYRLIV